LGGEQRTQGDLVAASLEDTASGIALDGIKVLADTGQIGKLALGVLLDGIVQARNGALGNVTEGLCLRKGSKGDGGKSVLHLDCI
jgi:hypothetical protein